MCERCQDMILAKFIIAERQVDKVAVQSFAVVMAINK